MRKCIECLKNALHYNRQWTKLDEIFGIQPEQQGRIPSYTSPQFPSHSFKIINLFCQHCQPITGSNYEPRTRLYCKILRKSTRFPDDLGDCGNFGEIWQFFYEINSCLRRQTLLNYTVLCLPVW